MKALINPNEKIYDIANNLLGSRVAYFYEEAFEVSSPLFFIDVDDSLSEVDSQFYFYNDETNQVLILPDETLNARMYPTVTPEKTIDELVAELVAKKLAALTANTN